MESGSRVLKFVCHGRHVQRLAAEKGWYPAARYTNLRDIREQNFRGRLFLDIDWKKYDFVRHLEATDACRPLLTIAQDVEDIFQLDKILKEADQLKQFSQNVAIVPKDPRLARSMRRHIPFCFMLAYSVPTRYGGTPIAPRSFRGRVHLLGGRPDVQRRLAQEMNVVSIDCNRFTLDARFGDFFDGQRFRPHPIGGYERCLLDSISSIETLWADYKSASDQVVPGAV